MSLLPHSCPRDDYDEVFVREGEHCPNDCGWLAVEGDVEEHAVKRAQQCLDKWGPWLSLAEASRQSGVPLATLAQAVRERRLPALQVQAQRWLVRLSAVEARLGLNPRGKHGRGKQKPPE